MFAAYSRYLSSSTRFLQQCSLRASRIRQYSTSKTSLRRSYLYVPAGSQKMLDKSLTTGADVIIYDLEDSVAPSEKDKANARANLKKFLRVCPQTILPSVHLTGTRQEADIGPHSPHIAVRVNDVSTPFFEEDVVQIVREPWKDSKLLLMLSPALQYQSQVCRRPEDALSG